MKKLFTLYLIWAILPLLNSNVLFAQNSNLALRNSCLILLKSSNPSNLSTEKSIGSNTNISSRLNIYPNPNNGKLCIDLKEPKSKIEIEIYNFLGQKIYESSTLLPLPTNEIDFSSRPKGIYLIKINDGQNNYAEKILIQ